jgi:hypothetical protein
MKPRDNYFLTELSIRRRVYLVYIFAANSNSFVVSVHMLLINRGCSEDEVRMIMTGVPKNLQNMLQIQESFVDFLSHLVFYCLFSQYLNYTWIIK